MWLMDCQSQKVTLNNSFRSDQTRATGNLGLQVTPQWVELPRVQKGVEYAILTDELSRAWSGTNTRQYKRLEGLAKENLRDNMSTLELVLNMLAGATTTEIPKQQQSTIFAKNIDAAW